MKKAFLRCFIVQSLVVSIIGTQEISFAEIKTETKGSIQEDKVIDISNILGLKSSKSSGEGNIKY